MRSFPGGLPRSPIRFEDALRELYRVHELEQARLLRVASSLRTASARRSSAPSLPFPRSPRERLGCRDVAEWRALAREEIRTAREDEARILPLFGRLARAPVEAWPSAIAIANAALGAGKSDTGLVALARALIGEERFEEAFSILHDVLLDDPPEDLRLEVLEAAAVGLELAGDLEGALASYEAALATRGSDLRQAVPLLALALYAGDGARASVARDRLHELDLGVPGIRSRFRTALAETRKRLARARVARFRSIASPEARAQRERTPARELAARRELGVRRFLARNRGPEAAVAALVLQG